MFVYVILEALVGIVGGIVLAVRTKKAEGVTYGKLDKAGRIINIVLIPVYLIPSWLYMLIGMLCRPAHGGFLGLIGWLLSIIAGSAFMICGLGLGASVALRKKGKSKLSFAIQFAGIVGIILSFLIFCGFYGNLLAPIN